MTARGVLDDPMSGAPPVAERARPPGWRPPVHPPPAPVAAAVAVPRPVPPLSLRPRPPLSAKPAASAVPAAPSAPAVPGRPEGFAMLAWFLGFRLLGRIGGVLVAEAPAGFVEAVARLVEVGSVALGAALVVGLWQSERWVGRAAVFWAASLAVLRIVGEMDGATYYSVSDFFWNNLLFAMILPVATAAYVWHKAAGIPPAPSPSPAP